MAHRMTHVLTACAAASLTAAPAHAIEAMRDPMRPPATASTPAMTGAGAEAPPAPVLQSVIIGADRRHALISGRRVAIGDDVAGARVTRIEDGRVTLRGPQGTRELRLYPQVTKTPSRAVRPERALPPRAAERR